MEEKEFNLWDERWIRVMQPNCTVQEISMKEALLKAHTFAALAGEMATQNIAVLRLLLAVLHTIFSRMDEKGEKKPIRDEDDALDRWEALWSLGHFPEKPIRLYLEEWYERFYLFHPERPFYQVYGGEEGKNEYTAAKLNGAISESGHKVRLFAGRKGAQKKALTYAEAARWLINLNGFDDAAAKTKTGVGWLGQIGLIAAEGENLFETLMLNLVALNSNGEIWKKNKPIWEQEKQRTEGACEIPIPDNLAELYTLQSRKALLIRHEDQVTDYRICGGVFFDSDNAFAEPMTMWKYVPGKGSQAPFCQPQTHDPTKQIWREFSALVPKTDEGGPNTKQTTKIPGVVKWQQRLKYEGILNQKSMARFVIASVQYGSSNSSVADVFSDSISFHLNLLTEAGKEWVRKIEAEIQTTDDVATAAMYLGMNIEKAAGGSGNVLGGWMKEQFYDRIDVPFRRFLETIDPADDYEQRNERLDRWHEEERRIAYKLSQEIVEQEERTNLITGRTSVKEKKDGTKEKQHYSVPEANERFTARINYLLRTEKGVAE